VTDRDDVRFFMTGMKVWRDGSPSACGATVRSCPSSCFVRNTARNAPAFRGLVAEPFPFAGSVADVLGG